MKDNNLQIVGLILSTVMLTSNSAVIAKSLVNNKYTHNSSIKNISDDTKIISLNENIDPVNILKEYINVCDRILTDDNFGEYHNQFPISFRSKIEDVKKESKLILKKEYTTNDIIRQNIKISNLMCELNNSINNQESLNQELNLTLLETETLLNKYSIKTDNSNKSNELTELEDTYADIQKNKDNKNVTNKELNYNIQKLRSLNLNLAILEAKGTAMNELADVISQMEVLLSTSSFGEYHDQYPEFLRMELEKNIDDARNVLIEGSRTDDEVRDITRMYSEFISSFIALKNDFSSLVAELLNKTEEAIRKKNAANIGNEKGDYPASAVESLNYAIDIANEKIGNPNLTQNELNIEIDNITAAIMLFDSSVIIDIDKTILLDKISEVQIILNNAVEGDRPGQYKADDKFILEEKLSDIRTRGLNCSYSEMLTLTSELEEAKLQFIATEIKESDIDKTHLISTIENATKIADEAVVGNAPGNYTHASLNALQMAIQEAINVKDSTTANQTEVNEAKDKLDLDIIKFTNSVIKDTNVDIKILLDLINEAEGLLANTPVGEENGCISQDEHDKLKGVINNAYILMNSVTLEQGAVDEYCVMFNQSIMEFKTNIKSDVDVTKLLEQIKAAKEIRSEVTSDMIGNNNGQYPLDVVEAFDAAIKKAEETATNVNASQILIDEASESLRKEIIKFRTSKIEEVYAKEALLDIIKESEDFLNNISIGNKDGEYPQDNVDKFKDVLVEAKKLYDATQFTQDEIDTMVKDLKTSLTVLKSSEITKYKDVAEELIKVIESAHILYKGAEEGYAVDQFKPEDKRIFLAQIEYAQAIIDKGEKDSSVYEAAIEKLTKEKAEFEKKRISSEEVAELMVQMEVILKEMSDLTISSSVGGANGGVAENQKIAINLILTTVQKAVENSNNLQTISEAMLLSKCAISDFKDNTLGVDASGNVFGRLLTGREEVQDTTPAKVNTDDATEFIPQAGIPIDVKTLLANLGFGFIGLSGLLNIKKKTK